MRKINTHVADTHTTSFTARGFTAPIFVSVETYLLRRCASGWEHGLSQGTFEGLERRRDVLPGGKVLKLPLSGLALFRGRFRVGHLRGLVRRENIPALPASDGSV
eukprot:4263604-Pyramimonas_sp.AAC.1